MPVVVVEAPPGAEMMPAAAGLAGAPTGGLVPTPGAVPVWAPAPAPCANAGAPLPITAIAMSAERCSLCRMVVLQCWSPRPQRGRIPAVPENPHRPITLAFCRVMIGPLLNRVPGGNIPGRSPCRGAHDVNSQFSGISGKQGDAKGQGAQRRARSRPYLPHAGGAAPPFSHPLYVFRPYRPQIVDRLRLRRARHRQFLYGDVLFS